MPRILLGLAFAASLGMVPVSLASAQSTSEAARAAVASPSRPDSDRARDQGRRPAEALTFFGVEPGMHVLEFGSGGGYFTELLSLTVGGQGQVLAQNPFFFFDLAGEELNNRYRSSRLQNVAVIFGSPAALAFIPDNSVDAAFIIDTYHDIAYQDARGDAQPPVAAQTLSTARRILRPGGIFGVIDHRASTDASRAGAAALHRVAESTLRADFEAAGFIFEGSLEIYANPDDDRTRAWFQDPALRDNTDRLIHRYRSPD